MSEYEFTTEDMAAMGREGTRRNFILMLRRPTNEPASRSAAAVSERMPVDHIPGAWPAGTSSGAPGVRVCPCQGCAKYADGRPGATA